MGKWEAILLGNLCEIVGGGTPSKQIKVFYTGNIPWASVRDMNSEVIDETEFKITEEAVKNSSTNIIKKDSIIIATRVGLGKVSFAGTDLAINQDLKGIIVNDKISNRYLFFFFQNKKQFLIESGTGATVKGVKLDLIKNLKIPLPPLQEQQRIVTKLDGLFAKIDQAIGLLEDNIAHTQALMDSVLDEELSGMNYNLSKWETKTWKDVLEVKNGKNQKAVLNPNGKYPIYGSGGIMNYADDYLCNENTVIIGRKGTINKPIYVKTKFWNVDTAFGLESKENLLPRFLFFFCIHFNFMSLNKSTTLPSLAKRDLLEVRISLPPLEIQKKILSKLEEVNKFKDNIIKTQTQKLNHLKALKSSLLDQAFKGEL